MRIAILGYGKEGKSAKSYFQNQHHDTKIFDNFTPETIAKEDFSSFDLVLRSPSLKPHNGWSSMTLPHHRYHRYKGQGDYLFHYYRYIKVFRQNRLASGKYRQPST